MDYRRRLGCSHRTQLCGGNNNNRGVSQQKGKKEKMTRNGLQLLTICFVDQPNAGATGLQSLRFPAKILDLTTSLRFI